MFTRGTQCIRVVVDPSTLELSLSLYRHPSIYLPFISLFTFNNEQKRHFGEARVGFVGLGHVTIPTISVSRTYYPVSPAYFRIFWEPPSRDGSRRWTWTPSMEVREVCRLGLWTVHVSYCVDTISVTGVCLRPSSGMSSPIVGEIVSTQ